MTVREAYTAGVEALRAAEVATDSPELDARVLLIHLLGTDLTGLLNQYSEPFDDLLTQEWERLLEDRGQGLPVAWLVGHQEFMGLDFAVGDGVLVPRADTETLVEAALELAKHGTRVLDACTGSGCVGVSLAALSPALVVTCTDLSSVALGYARQNALTLVPDQNLTFVQTDLLEGVDGQFDLIVSNPPYLTPVETTQRQFLGWREPVLALDGGGDDGLRLIRKLAAQAHAYLAPDGWLLVEGADAQSDTIIKILKDNGFVTVRIWRDLAGQRRVTGAQLPPS